MAATGRAAAGRSVLLAARLAAGRAWPRLLPRGAAAATIIIPAAAAGPSAGSAAGAYNPAAAPGDGVGGRRIEDTLAVGRVAIASRSLLSGPAVTLWAVGWLPRTALCIATRRRSGT